MGIFAALFERRAEVVSLTHPKDPALARMFSLGQETAAGANVNETTALNFSAYFAGVRLIAESVASLPLVTYRRTVVNDQEGKERATDHAAYRLLHDEPHADSSSIGWREAMMGHVLTYGNGYSRILRRGRRVDAIELLWPDTVEVWRRDSGAIAYTVRPREGGQYTLEQGDVVHVHGLSFDGLIGYSPVALARESIGLGLAAERYGSQFFGANGVPSGILEHPGRLSDQALQRLQDSWSARHKSRGKMQILEEGMKYARIGLPPEDSQFLQTRQFQVQEIARWLNIPPHKLGDLSRTTYSNVEQEDLNYLKDTLRPWLRRWEQELNRKLFTGPDAETVFCEHLVLDLLSVDAKSRGDFYAQMIGHGVMSINEVRGRENLNAIGDEGDQHFVPVNLANLESMMPGVGVMPGAGQPMMEVDDEGEAEAEDDGQAEAQGEMMRSVAAELLGQLFGSLAAATARDAMRTAKKPDKFGAWIDAEAERVDSQLRLRLPAILRLLRRNDAADVAAGWRDMVRQRMLDVSGRSYPSTLEANVAEESEGMQRAAETYLRGLMTEAESCVT